MPSNYYLCRECAYFFTDVLGSAICTFNSSDKPTWDYCPSCPKFKTKNQNEKQKSLGVSTTIPVDSKFYSVYICYCHRTTIRTWCQDRLSTDNN